MRSVDDNLEVPHQPDVLEPSPQAEIPVRHDGQLETERSQPVERFEHSREHFEMECSDVCGRELFRIELGLDCVEEDPGALLLQPRQACFVVALACARSVVRGLGSEAREHGRRRSVDPAFGEDVQQRRDGIPEPDERAVRVEGDRVEIAGPHATHCHRAHCTTATPRKSALQATIAVWSRGFPALSAARARKNGKITSPKRGRESNGQRELG